MPNLRILYNNAAKRVASITADTTLGGLAATNMLSDIKSDVWRGSNATTATLTLAWAANEPVACVALPFCSLSSTAQMRVKCYSDQAATVQTYSTGWVNASPSSLIGSSSDWGVLPFGVNAYNYGGSACAVAYFPVQTVRAIRVDLQDTANPLGYIEAGCIVVGAYWSPVYNVQYGEATIEVTDQSKHERSDAGDLFTDRGPTFKTLNLTVQHMPATDRDAIWRILRGNGMAKPVFVSLVPESTDTMDEQIFSLYGKLSKGSSIQYQFMGQYMSALQIEEL